MLKEQRHCAILDELNKSGYASIPALSAALHISRSTIRRDILDLEAMGKLRRTRGGAAAFEQRPADEPSFDARQISEQDEKQRIAMAALSLVKPNETLILSGGTTVHEFARTLNSVSPLYVATTDLMSAVDLSKFLNVELTIIGGTVRHRHYNVVGYFTESMIRQIHADKAFVGVDAIDFDIGLMNFSSEDITVNRMIMEASKQVIILCDHTKFSAIAFANICAFNEIDILITGKEAAPENVRRLEEMGITVLLV